MKFPFVRQYYIGRSFGLIFDSYQRSVTMMSVFQYLAMMVVLYSTSVQPWLALHFKQINFPIYLLCALFLAILVMIASYIIGAPSSYAFYNNQIWKHDNPMREKLETLERNQRKIMDKLGIQEDESVK